MVVHAATLIRYLLVAALIFGAAEISQYIYISWETQPALLLPACGIGLAIVWHRGYRYGYAVFAGLLLALLYDSTDAPVPYFLGAVQLAQMVSIVVATFLLQRFAFVGTFTNIRDVLLFLAVVVVAGAIAPAFVVGIGTYFGVLSEPLYLYFSSAWAGWVFSCVLITPAILAWLRPAPAAMSHSAFEAGFVSTLLVITVYVFFWTDVLPQYSFLFFTSFFLAHFWACLRLSHRIVVLSIITTAVLSIIGLLLFPRSAVTFGSQLFTLQLFLLTVVPIFYAFSALVKERTQTIIELRRAKDDIEHESVRKNEFIAVLAHELRNPLAPIRTTLEILELEAARNPEIRKLIVTAGQHVHSMRRLLDDLLDITRVTHGKFQLQLEQVALKTVVDAAVHSTQTLLTERQHRLIRNEECEQHVYLNVDSVRFEQVIVNLLNNAAKYTDPGGVIEIICTVRDSTLILSVRDTGQGIEAEHLPHVFDSFWQKNSVARSGTGIGVGLSLTKRIVELHNGTIVARSEGRNRGSVFTITLPIVTTPRQSAATTDISVPVPQSFKVLVVDDNSDAANALAQLLARKGHVTKAVYSGREALAAVVTFAPEVVLLDIGLPDQSGYDVARTLRQTGYQGVLLALSGYGQKEDKAKALAVGFDQHFTKPMSVSSLEEYLAHIKVGDQTAPTHPTAI